MPRGVSPLWSQSSRASKEHKASHKAAGPTEFWWDVSSCERQGTLLPLVQHERRVWLSVGSSDAQLRIPEPAMPSEEGDLCSHLPEWSPSHTWPLSSSPVMGPQDGQLSWESNIGIPSDIKAEDELTGCWEGGMVSDLAHKVTSQPFRDKLKAESPSYKSNHTISGESWVRHDPEKRSHCPVGFIAPLMCSIKYRNKSK